MDPNFLFDDSSETKTISKDKLILEKLHGIIEEKSEEGVPNFVIGHSLGALYAMRLC